MVYSALNAITMYVGSAHPSIIVNFATGLSWFN